jgi:hypothetical protein
MVYLWSILKMMLLLNIGYMLKSIVAVPPHISLSSTPLVIYITSLMPQPSIPFCHSTQCHSHKFSHSVINLFFSYDSLFQRSPIKPLFELSENSNNSSLFLHNIFKHSSSVYGLYFLPKKKQTILNFFNEYKRATFITDSE